MKVTKKLIVAILTDELTQLEEESFKWGNTPNEATRLKRGVLNLKQFATMRLMEGAPVDKVKFSNRQLAPVIQDFLLPCETIESVESLVQRFSGWYSV